jgi:hypothetical protein
MKKIDPKGNERKSIEKNYIYDYLFIEINGCDWFNYLPNNSSFPPQCLLNISYLPHRA